MIIQWEGKSYALGFTDLTMKQAETIEAETGMPVGEWLDQIGADDGLSASSPQFLKALKVIYWLMLNQNGDPTPIGAVDFPIGKFGEAFAAASAAQAPARAAPVTEEALDPTLGTRFPATAFPAPSIPPGGMSSPPAAPQPSAPA